MKATLIVEGKEFPIEINDPELQKLIAPPKKTGYERVADGYAYYFANSFNNIMAMNDEGDDADIRYKNGNYYSSAAVAENNARADKLMRQLRRFAVEHREKDIDWSSSKHAKWVICYDYENAFIKTFPHYSERYPFALFFDSRESAELAIELFHDELIWYFTEYKDSL